MRILVVAIVLVGCSNKQDANTSAKTERPAPFEITVNKVEELDTVAPNKTYLEQGLGKKAPDGKIFACIQYAVTNKSDKPETLPAPNVTDAKGAKIDLSMTAAGNYLPEDWKADTGLAKIEPATTVKRADCFEVAKDATTGMSLGFVDTGWGPKFKPWHTSVPLSR